MTVQREEHRRLEGQQRLEREYHSERSTPVDGENVSPHEHQDEPWHGKYRNGNINANESYTVKKPMCRS